MAFLFFNARFDLDPNRWRIVEGSLHGEGTNGWMAKAQGRVTCTIRQAARKQIQRGGVGWVCRLRFDLFSYIQIFSLAYKPKLCGCHHVALTPRHFFVSMNMSGGSVRDSWEMCVWLKAPADEANWPSRCEYLRWLNTELTFSDPERRITLDHSKTFQTSIVGEETNVVRLIAGMRGFERSGPVRRVVLRLIHLVLLWLCGWPV